MVRDLGLPSDGVTRGSSRWTLAVGAAGLAVLLSGCVQGPPEASGTLPPLPSVSPDVPAETPTPSATTPSTPAPDEEPAPPPASSTPSEPATPTPTATPTAPAPEGLTPSQLEAAAFVEKFYESFARSLDERDATLTSSLMTPDCTCREAAALIQTTIDQGGVRQGAEIRVTEIRSVVGEDASRDVLVAYNISEEPGRINYPDGTSAEVPGQTGLRLMSLLRADSGYLVGGATELDEP